MRYLNHMHEEVFSTHPTLSSVQPVQFQMRQEEEPGQITGAGVPRA